MSELDTEWLEALEIEPTGDAGDDGGAGDEDDDDKAGAGDDAGNADGNDDDDQGAADDDSKGADDDSKGEDSDDDDAPGDGEVDGDADGAADDAGQVDHKAIVKEAISEIQSSQEERYARYESLKKEAAERLYPEGIDRTLRDSEGDPINGIDDLTKLINPKTGDYFTDEEAGAWLLAAQQKLNKDVETVERFVEQVAETNLLLTEGAERVAAKYGHILSQDKALKDRLLAAFDKTLIKDPNTGVTLRVPMDVEEFFDLNMEPRLASAAEKAEAEKREKAEKAKKAKAAQGERADLKPSGKSERLSDADKEWAQAYKDYEEGV